MIKSLYKASTGRYKQIGKTVHCEVEIRKETLDALQWAKEFMEKYERRVLQKANKDVL